MKKPLCFFLFTLLFQSTFVYSNDALKHLDLDLQNRVFLLLKERYQSNFIQIIARYDQFWTANILEQRLSSPIQRSCVIFFDQQKRIIKLNCL